MGKTFVAGYISLAEGEKDPRNLLVAFAIARVILIEFDISDHTEVCDPRIFGDPLIHYTFHSHYSTLLFAIFQSHFDPRPMTHMASLRRICDWR